MRTPAVTYLVLAIGTLATLLLLLGVTWTVQSLVMSVALVGALAYLAIQVEGARAEQSEVQHLRDAYDQLDKQAKLIIRTDLELHRTQEELDRRLQSLMSLHQLGRQLAVSLRPDEVFAKLDADTVLNFGFSKALLGMCSTHDTIAWGSLIRINEETAQSVTDHLISSGLLKRLLDDAKPLLIEAAAGTEPAQRKLVELLHVPAAVVVGVSPHNGPYGCLLLGREGGWSVSDPKGDEELVSILSNQLAVAVENSTLYEKAWLAQQDLERKVQERTKELAEANAQLVRLNKAKSDFVSAVSHELRTPMAAIKGYASLLGTGQFGPLAAPQAERIGKIEKHVDLLTQMINNMLDIARIESGRVTMERQQIPVKDFVAIVHDLVHPQLEAKRLKYTVDLDGVTHLIGDSQHLQRVFLNLLSNAIKYTPEGGTIRWTLAREGDRIHARVNDTGFGVSPEELPKLFQEFYRANDPINQQIRGTGLGLALVKRIVEAHQGTIGVVSEKGKGTTFTVTLPAS